MRILFLNPQGNFDSADTYWTEHPDFGGQLVYVKELAINMAQLGHQVDIVTRQVTQDPDFKMFAPAISGYEGVERVRIVRLPCGPGHFLPKESLWPHLPEWVDNILAFYHRSETSFDFITTHYADGGLAGALLSERSRVPFSFTGHSLGAQKMDKLDVDEKNYEDMNEQFRFAHRIAAERLAMSQASRLFVSTTQERDEQYAHIAYDDAVKAGAPSRFVIAPPGANTVLFSSTETNELEEETHALIDGAIKRDINTDRHNLPFMVAASRLDAKKNHVGLLEAYASNQTLQSMANVAISVRGVDNVFEDISGLKAAERIILNQCLDMIDRHHLEGKVTFINITSQKALASSYRYFARKRSIFALTALYEPFGLAPIEAMSCGLPAAVTRYGGPADVLKDAEGTYGVLLDVHDPDATAEGFIKTFNHYDYYRTQGLHRVMSRYTWQATARVYLDAITTLLEEASPAVNVPDYLKSKTCLSQPNHTYLKAIYLKHH
ncbi:MAG: glycosyltransferase family 1 protein [Acholeplasmatales bacterium]|nr:MAG: glycosyltransferase family 1 protein [Acholeplasmatales bacterium]